MRKLTASAPSCSSLGESDDPPSASMPLQARAKTKWTWESARRSTLQVTARSGELTMCTISRLPNDSVYGPTRACRPRWLPHRRVLAIRRGPTKCAARLATPRRAQVIARAPGLAHPFENGLELGQECWNTAHRRPKIRLQNPRNSAVSAPPSRPTSAERKLLLSHDRPYDTHDFLNNRREFSWLRP